MSFQKNNGRTTTSTTTTNGNSNNETGVVGYPSWCAAWDMAPSIVESDYVECKVTQNLSPWFGEPDFDGWL